jgi:hypothetical protein
MGSLWLKWRRKREASIDSCLHDGQEKEEQSLLFNPDVIRPGSVFSLARIRTIELRFRGGNARGKAPDSRGG